jgi:hypothetical protein
MMIKPGVDISNLTVQALLILVVAQRFRPNVRLTSGRDGQHKPNSKHYVGQAVDLGCHEYDALQNRSFIEALKSSLGADFDVLHEYVGTPNEHIHVEYDPKGKK